MMRHARVEELAKYDEDDLRPHKRRRIAAHLAVCVQCTANHKRLHAVATVLADVSYPPMPEHLSARIHVAIASESTARVASEPATEAGRGALPERKRPARAGLRISRISSPLGLRLVAAAGAAVVLAGGGYAIATGLGSPSPTSSASSPQSVHANLTPDSSLRITSHGRIAQIQMVRSKTNFQRGTFKAQALAAVSANSRLRAHSSGLASRPPSAFSGITPAPTSSAASSKEASPNSGASTGQSSGLARLQGCVGLIAGGRTLLLVELALFQNHAAAIIVVRPAGTSALEAYAVGSSCSATRKDILFSLRLPG